MPEFALEEVPATTVATMRRTIPVERLRTFVGVASDHVAAAVEDAGGRTGPPFAWYHGMPDETVDVSAGVEVVGDVHPTEGGVSLVERPGGRAAVAVHTGSHESLAQTWRRLLGWLGEQGLSPGREGWEEYLTPPEGDPSRWRTRVVALVD